MSLLAVLPTLTGGEYGAASFRLPSAVVINHSLSTTTFHSHNQLKRLQAIHNSLARRVISSSRFQHITPGLTYFRWPNVEQRIQYKLIALTYSSLQHNSPLFSVTPCHTNQTYTG